MKKIISGLTLSLCLFTLITGCSNEQVLNNSSLSTTVSRATFVEGEKFTDWFNGYSTGSFSSDDYSTNGGSWKIIDSSGNLKLQETSGSSTAFIYNNNIKTDDVTLIAKVKSQSSSTDAGLVAKYSDSSNYYTMFLDDNQLKLKKKVNGSWTTLDSASFSFSTSTTYELKLVIDGNSLKGYINSTLYVEASDSSLNEGYFGLRTYKNKAIFDAFQIYYTGESSTPTEPTDTTAPGNVTNLTAVAGDGQVTLSWSNPSDEDFVNTTITATPSTYTTTLKGESKTITGLTNGTTYTFTLKTNDDSGNASSGKTISATPEAETTTTPSADYPYELMRNYKQWKITYPDSSEVKDLEGERNEYFYVEGDAIVFKAPIRSDNGTTPNSSYIRSELRERTEDGKSDIYWTTDGTSVCYVEQAITHLPTVKDHLVATQIHGNKADGIDDAMVLRLEGEHLFLCFNGGKLADDVTITTNYKLGTKHEVIFEVVNGKHYVYYSENGGLSELYQAGNADNYLVKGNDGKDYVMDLDYDQSYFKVGNYTQSNSEKEGSETDEPDNYGEVKVWDFWVEHK